MVSGCGVVPAFLGGATDAGRRRESHRCGSWWYTKTVAGTAAGDLPSAVGTCRACRSHRRGHHRLCFAHAAAVLAEVINLPPPPPPAVIAKMNGARRRRAEARLWAWQNTLSTLRYATSSSTHSFAAAHIDRCLAATGAAVVEVNGAPALDVRATWRELARAVRDDLAPPLLAPLLLALLLAAARASAPRGREHVSGPPRRSHAPPGALLRRYPRLLHAPPTGASLHPAAGLARVN